ncbi:MAG: DUF2726 domain-containing protein [Defluviitaleaceae bacterium]|nr:DUF2726 domain-containing protein [Defluviitaleaceae bacterium]
MYYFINNPIVAIFTVVVVVVLLIILYFLTLLKNRRYSKKLQLIAVNSEKNNNNSVNDKSLNNANAFNYSPYKLESSLITLREFSFFRVLKLSTSKHNLHIIIKPRIADFVTVSLNKYEKGSLFNSYFNKINRKHIDFLLCNQDFKPILGFEVDDSTHQRPDRVERDSFVGGLYKFIGLPVHHVYDWNNPDTIENYITSNLPK